MLNYCEKYSLVGKLCFCHFRKIGPCLKKLRSKDTVSVIQIRDYSAKLIPKFPKVPLNTKLRLPNDIKTATDVAIDKVSDKVLFNSYYLLKNDATRWKLRQIEFKEQRKKEAESPIPMSLKYIIDDEDCIDILNAAAYNPKIPEETEYEVNFPYSSKESNHIIDDEPTKESYDHQDKEIEFDDDQTRIADYITTRPENENWLSDYECYEEKEEEGIYEEEIPRWGVNYGTHDASIPISSVPCGGCGAFLHCQNPSIPGYLPKELFIPCNDNDLKQIVCQRCHFMKQYNTALNVNIDPDYYPKLMESLKAKKALIILMVDMTDFPCSIWPQILDVIGEDKPLVVVGNKIDLIRGDSRSWLREAEKSLKAALPNNANIKHVQLISAKTGFGIEDLITKLYGIWQTKGDVYLVGCTNVGKSTLFNVLLNSDYCKVQAIDLIQRATTSRWPGTTLNLLKFPIHRISGWKLFLRTERMKIEREANYRERELEKIQNQHGCRIKRTLPQIIGHIGRTFVKHPEPNEYEFELGDKRFSSEVTSGKAFNENDEIYKLTKWCYDTPGLVHPEQILNILTTEELVKIVPNDIIEPQAFRILPEQTVFIAGLGRIDLLESSEKPTRFIVYAPNRLPITICDTKHADEVYTTLLGTEVLGVPFGSKTRIKKFPKLQSAPEFHFVGISIMEIALEVVLSNAGWVSFVTERGANCAVRVWTPNGKGIFERKKPLLKFMPRLCKTRYQKSPLHKMKTLE